MTESRKAALEAARRSILVRLDGSGQWKSMARPGDPAHAPATINELTAHGLLHATGEDARTITGAGLRRLQLSADRARNAARFAQLSRHLKETTA